MYKNIFLLFALLFFTGCAERGYKLSSNIHTRTATAQSSIDINKQTSLSPQKLKKMKQAVKKQLNNQTFNSKDYTKKNTLTVLKQNIFRHQLTEDELLSSLTEDLIFKRFNQTYQKFGDSEIHGHVIYLAPTGNEIRLKSTRIYLLATNNKLNNWYQNAYLKNKYTRNSVKVNYINSTYLDLSKNFAFHGIAPGEYFVIIVSDSPKKDEKNKKIYIAKKIKVEKRKKIMAVFSKKLQ